MSSFNFRSESPGGVVGGAVTAGTVGSVLFVGAGGVLAQDNSNLFWDNTNDRLGVDTGAPTHSLTLGSTGTGISLYNTADQAINYERFVIYYNSNILELSTFFGGSGASRALRIGGASAAGGAINTHLAIDPTAGAPFFNFTRSSGITLHPFIATSGINPIASSGSQTILSLSPVVLQSSTAGYVCLDINPTESSTGSGAKLLQRWAVGGTVKGSMDNTGLLTTGSTTLHATNVALTNGAGASTGTLTNAPSVGNPTKWIPISDNGTTRYIPAW